VEGATDVPAPVPVSAWIIAAGCINSLAWKIHEGADFGRDTNASAW
jgi:hypothetical protein